MSFVKIWGKIDCVFTAHHCIANGVLAISNPWYPMHWMGLNKWQYLFAGVISFADMETACVFLLLNFTMIHNDDIKWKRFPRYWPFVRGIHRSTVNSPPNGRAMGVSYELLGENSPRYIGSAQVTRPQRVRVLPHYITALLITSTTMGHYFVMGAIKNHLTWIYAINTSHFPHYDLC